jgi:hypothetical protein
MMGECSVWTRKKPEIPGWYWFQIPHREPEIVKVEKDADDKLTIWFSGSDISSMEWELDDIMWGPRIRHPES